jgi:hypothetical protein
MIKAKCELEELKQCVGIMTQVLLYKTIANKIMDERGRNNVIGHICLKINAKTGGVNSIIKDPR